jgi:hypothetical protein
MDDGRQDDLIAHRAATDGSCRRRGTSGTTGDLCAPGRCVRRRRRSARASSQSVRGLWRPAVVPRDAR